MKIQSALSVALCLTQLSLSVSGPIAFAGEMETTQAAPSAEFSLLENVMALQGTNLSQEALRSQLTGLVNGYLASAPSEGRTERLEQAMVGLGIYTPAQAQAFVTEATQAARTSADPSAAVRTLLSREASGAQFSWCALGGGLLVGISGMVIALGVMINVIADGSGALITNPVFDIGIAGEVGAVMLLLAGGRGDC